MEIVFLYIKSFNIIKNQGINFGGEYKFEYLPDAKLLKAVKNELYIPDFYNIQQEGAKVTNVTTIIGKNGSGKTSILEFIAYNFCEGRNLQNEMILVCKNEQGYSLFCTEKIKYEKSIITKQKVLIKKSLAEEEPFVQWDLGYNFRGLPQTDLIYFSNVFDGSPGHPLKGVYDISTNHLIFKDYTSAKQQHTISKNNGNQVGVHLLQDIYRQVRFLTDDISKKRIEFRLPDTLEVRINLEYLNGTQGNEELDSTYKSFRDGINKDLGYDSDDGFDNAIKRFIGYTLLNLVGQLMNVPASIFTLIYNSDFYLSPKKLPMSQLPLQEVVTLFLAGLEKQVNKPTAAVRLTPSIELIEATREFIAFVIQNKPKFISGTSAPDSQPFVIINVKEKDLMRGFVEHYLKTFSINSYLDFVWGKISSGERALLNIYSRFFSISDRAIVGSELKNNLIILIDEGDVYLHPAWQKKFVKYILDYLPIIFSVGARGVKRNLQIIFTTNSPIPASDILNYNTVFIEKVFVKENDSYTSHIKDSLNDQKETFAANIHTLLADSFFIHDGLIGEFASGKIDTVIQQLVNRVKLSAEERERMRLLIHQIGEPVIKNKLLQLYNNTYNLEIHERLDDIERRLKKGEL